MSCTIDPGGENKSGRAEDKTGQSSAGQIDDCGAIQRDAQGNKLCLLHLM